MALATTFDIVQGPYELTEASMRLRGQRPLHSGDDYQFDFVYKDSAGIAIDITGATITFTAKYAPSDADVAAIVQVAGAIDDAPNGAFSVVLAESDVVGPAHIRGIYDLQITIGSTTETIISGNIEFLPNLTQSTP